MSSSSSRARIDQFYPSRKRKPPPPSLKDEKSDKGSKSPIAAAAAAWSPSAKGTLETYLVKSPDDVSPRTNLRASSLPSSSSTPGPIRRNLTKEINLTYDVSISRSKDLSVSTTDEKKEDASAENSELKKFATDFLSLYCSDIPPMANLPTEQESKGQKRSGSPSLLAACSKASMKKQCVLDHADPTVKLDDSSCSKDKDKECSEPLKVYGGSDGGGLSLRKCSNTPKSSLIKTDICSLAGETPKSVSRSSMFSPGDEFWNEAIQVVDGLFVSVDDRLINDRSSGVALKDARNSEADGCAKPVDENVEGSERAKEHKQVSPLPVKHFDFSREGNISGQMNSSRQCIEEVGAATDTSSVNPAVPPPISAKRSDLVLENGSDLEESEMKSGFSAEKNDTRHIQTNGVLPGRLIVPHNKHSSVNNSFKYKSVANANNEETGTPSSSLHAKDHLQLSSWLPSEVCSIYMKKGISKLYQWQVDCLLVDGVLDKRNLVYCASTSAGKSFVAEILMLRRVISTEKMALLVLPYVSICTEKAEHLELLLEPLGKHVRSFYGNQGGGSLPKDTSVAVCTIEKANSLINRLLEEGRLLEVGIIVIDELHMVGDPHRGYLLELLLTKLRYAAGEGHSESCSDDSSGSSSGKADPAHGLQIVGMSATMPNVGAVADWLQAALYETDFRPVPLEEYIKVGNNILDKKMNVVRKIPETAYLGGKDPDHIVELCNEVVQEGHSVLLFCSSRKGCESTARHVSKFLKEYSAGMRNVDCEYNDASSALEALRKSPAGLDPILEETLPSGVAYHHAGLTVEEREVIETCYRKGIVRVLTATSTLAAGVNLPARRVIFRQPRIGRDFIDGTRYKQMAGRAGRTGIDTKGESILVCKPDEVKKVSSILNDSCPPLQSCLSEDKNGMTHAILEVVAGGIVQSASDIHRYVKCTLLNSTKPFEDVVKSAQDSLRWLCHKKFLEWNEETRLYSSTPLGRAAFGSSLTPEESLIVLDDLSRAREGFVLASDLHLVYLVTPINVEVEPDWELYYERFMELSILDQSVGNRVGVAEPFLMRMAHGAPMLVQERLKGKKSGYGDKHQKQMAANNKNLLSSENTLRVCRRFYVALMLSRLVQEVPVVDVCEAFKVSRGMIQGLQENAGRFALMVSVFCERLGWHDFEGIIAKFQNRVSFGVRAEIVELTTIPYVKGSRARALYKAGLRTPLAIAEASVPEIAKALFESSAWAGQEGSALRRVQLGVAKKIKNGARKIVLDQAEEARVAAFSAFKSLGVDVPTMSRPSLSNVVGDYSTRNGGTLSSTKVCRSSYNDVIIENPQFPVRPADGGRNSINHSSFGTRTNSDVYTMTVKDIRDVNSIREVQDACTTVTGGSAAVPCGKLQKIGKTINETNIASYANDVNKTIVPDQKESDTVAGNECDYVNSKFNDQGPTNASNFPGGIDCFLDLWGAESEFYFDIHFSERSEVQSPILFEVFGLAICWENSPVYYVNVWKDLAFSGKLKNSPNATKDLNVHNVKNSPNAIKDLNVHNVWALAEGRWDRIAKIMSRNGVRKITWNLKNQIQVLKIPCISVQRLGKLKVDDKLSGIKDVGSSYFLLPPITVHDGIDMCLAAWILWPDEESKSSPNLEKVVKKHLSTEVAAAANRSGRWRNQMRKAAHDGCCRRVAQARALSSVLWKLIVSEDLVEVFIGIENPLVEVLAEMELWGIGVDMEGCLRARHILVKKLKELEKDAHRLAGISFSLNTTADIANVLFSRLKLPIPQSCKKGKLHPSTDKHSLDMLKSRHPIVSVIKEHRTLSKLLNSTLGSVCSRARLYMKSQKYIVKGHWLQTSTATGRLSMEEPNLQCVEHLVVFTTHPSENNSTFSEIDQHQINARDFFIPTQDNWLLLTADYSQIELRLMAHFSKDPSLIELLSKPDGDCFTMIAARWTGKLESTISSHERDQTKRLIYGILYGMGVNSLAEQLECSSEEAADKIQSFKASFPAVNAWIRDVVASCRLKGYIKTLMGRKRFLSKIKFGSNKEKAKAERQAVNSICQGSAADIIKIAMIKIHGVIAEESANAELATKFSMLKGCCRIILQVHDELVLETDPCVLREAGLLLQMSMENAASLLVPLNVKLKYGKTWGSLETFHQET